MFILNIFSCDKYLVSYARNVGRNAVCVNEKCPSVFLVFMQLLIKFMLAEINEDPFDRLGFLHGKAKRRIFATCPSKCSYVLWVAKECI